MQKSIKISILVVVLLIVGGLTWYYFSTHSVPEPEKGGVSLTSRPESLHEESDKYNYTVDVVYPVVQSKPEVPAQESFNNELRSLIRNMVDGFTARADVRSSARDNGSSSALVVRGEIALLSAEAVSVRFSVSDYTAGAAHPNSYAVGYTYDLRKRARVGLADLFTPGSSYLPFLAEYSRRELLAQFGNDAGALGDSIQAGTEPKGSNYQTFILSTAGLTVLFNPYQVAPYAAGIREVSIPYSDTQSIAKSGGLLERLVQ